MFQFAVKSPEWEDEFCSNECAVKHCKKVFSQYILERAMETVCSWKLSYKIDSFAQIHGAALTKLVPWQKFLIKNLFLPVIAFVRILDVTHFFAWI